MCGCENIWFELLGKRQKVIIGIVYRHPQYNIDEFSQSLSETITKIAKNNYAYYVSGNINKNLLNATNDSRIQKYIDTLCSHGCYPIINKLTTVVNEAESCIDPIYTNNLSTGDVIMLPAPWSIPGPLCLVQPASLASPIFPGTFWTHAELPYLGCLYLVVESSRFMTTE